MQLLHNIMHDTFEASCAGVAGCCHNRNLPKTQQVSAGTGPRSNFRRFAVLLRSTCSRVVGPGAYQLLPSTLLRFERRPGDEIASASKSCKPSWSTGSASSRLLPDATSMTGFALLAPAEAAYTSIYPSDSQQHVTNNRYICCSTANAEYK